jgi:NAD(P)-dependent dehydrogenase (short-subunit alcohol dehydrogenase family)
MGVTANCLHPGGVDTELLRYNGWAGLIVDTARAIGKPFLLNAEQGAATSVYLASSREVEGSTGQYFAKQRAVRSSKASYDEAMAQRLWDVSEELAGLPTTAGAR